MTKRRAPVIGEDVLLFFRSRDHDTFVPGDHRLRQAVREATIPLRSAIWPRKHQVTGYEVSFGLLCRALRGAGMRVHVNQYRLARNNPAYPIGITGFPTVLEGWSLPNPALLGPGLYDHPGLNPTLMDDVRFRTILVKSTWMRDMFGPYYGRDRVHSFASGIETSDWPDVATQPKTADFLIYDKLRWNRDRVVPEILEPVVAELKRRRLRYRILRYGRYTPAEYRQALAASGAMIFLCENETQGMAWQEALASNVPILAWDQGFWLDPQRPRFEREPVRATSVPGFAPTCGERFRDAREFVPALDRFTRRQPEYEPRRWVETALSPALSARRYLDFYWKVASDAGAARRSDASVAGAGT